MSYDSDTESPTEQERNRRKKINYNALDEQPSQGLKLNPKDDATSHTLIIQSIPRKRKAKGIRGNEEMDEEAKDEFTSLLGKAPSKWQDYLYDELYR